MKLPKHIYVDGGTIGRNPSILGGTWCWAWISHHDNLIKFQSGVIDPEDFDLPKITNNITELYAAYRGLKSVPDHWNGTIHTDSKVTYFRITNSSSFNGCPKWFVDLIQERRRERTYNVRLVAGHPTQQELALGRKARNKLPISKWNVFCDKECQRLAR